MDMAKLHAAIRREVCASDRLRMMERAYKDNPTDGMAREFHRAAASRGFTRLADDGARRVLEGSTSLEELARVVDLTERLNP